MTNQHAIENAIFDISFGSEKEAFEQEADLGYLIKSRLMQIVDEVFDEVSSNRNVFRISELEVDLGEIAYVGFQEEMERRLRERLRAALHEKLAMLRSNTSSYGGVISAEQFELEHLESFLATGHVHWNSPLRNGRHIEELLIRAVGFDSTRLLEFMRRSPRRETIVQRLAGQFSDEALKDFASSLVPVHASFIASLVSDFRSIWTGAGFTQSTGRRFARSFWAILIDELLSSSGASSSRRYIVARIVARISRRLNASDARIMTAFFNEAEGLEKRGLLSQELAGAIESLPRDMRPVQEDVRDDSEPAEGNAASTESGAPTDAEIELEEQRSVEIALLRERLARAMIDGDTSEIEGIWGTTILDDHSDLLIEALNRHGRSVSVRKTIANEFPEFMLRDIVVLIEPGASGFINEVVERPELFQRAIGQPAKTAESLKSRLWEFTLTYLLVERGSRFNKRAYMMSLVRQMSAHENIRYHDLLGSLIGVLEEIEVSSTLKHELLQILGELQGSTPAAEQPDAPGSELMDSYALYERLRDRLVGGTAVQESDAQIIMEIVDGLARKYPEQLQRLFLELRSGDITLNGIVSVLSPSELAHLVRAFLSMKRHEGEGPSDLMRAVDSYAHSASDLRRYYAQILEHLVNDQIIDFEMIIARNQSASRSIALEEAISEEETSDMRREEQAAGMSSDGAADVPHEQRNQSSREPADRNEAGGVETTPDAPREGQPERRARDETTDASPAKDGETTSSSTPELPEHFNDELVNAYDLYEKLVEKLTQGASYSEDIARLINALTRRHPEQLQRLFLELRAGHVSTDVIVSALSHGELASIIQAFLSIGQLEGDGPTDLMRAVESYAKSAGNLGRYYAQILECLVQEQVIDLEAIIARNGSSPEPYDQHESQFEQGRSGVIEDQRSPPLDADSFEGQTADLRNTAANSPSSPHQSDRSSGEALDAYELYERLIEHLTLGASPAGDFKRRVDELLQKYPEQLQRLFLQLRSGEISLVVLNASLPPEELMGLIRAFLSLEREDGRTESVDLVRAIESYAKSAGNLGRYYTRILECLVQEQIIDFEAIIARNGSSIEASEQNVSVREEESQAVDREKSEIREVGQDALDALMFYVRHEGTISNADAARLIRAFELMLARHPARLRSLLEPLLSVREAVARVVELLPERLLARLLFLLRPAEHGVVQQYADILANACFAGRFALSGNRVRQLKWNFVFRYLFENGLRFDEQVFIQRFVDYLVEETNQTDDDEVRDVLARQVAINILPSARERYQSVLSALSTDEDDSRNTSAPIEKQSRSERDSRLARLYNSEPDEERLDEEIYIANAGMVLASPYIPRLFSMLGLLDDSAFKDRDAAERAIHLLQFMVNESTTTPEYQLVLNKLMCGVRTGVPITRGIDIDSMEKETIEGLIQGLIQNWEIIGNTSIDGFRESFLQREGRLQLKNGAWHLFVQPRAFDMLIDQIPWSFGTIKHPWMDRVIYVEWR